MYRKLLVCAVVLAAMLTLPMLATAEMVTADFEGGNVTNVVDAYKGMAGDGWASGWLAPYSNSSVTITHSVLDTNELVVDNYLRFKMSNTNTSSARTASLSRDYSDGIDVTEDYAIQFTMRIDEDLSAQNFSGSNDRYQIHDRVYTADGAVSSIGGFATGSCTWGIVVYGSYSIGSTNVNDHWIVYDYAASTFVDTGLTATKGVAYDFMIDFNTSAGTYDVSIIGDNSTSYSHDGFGLGTVGGTLDGHQTTGYLSYSGVSLKDSNDATNYREFSLDGISITQVPEPSLFAMVLGLALAGLLGCREK